MPNDERPFPVGPDGVARAVELFQAGRERRRSFQHLYQTFFPALLRFFARKGLAGEDCEDLAQETLLGVYNGLDGFRGDSSFETWLYRAAVMTYRKRLRSAATAKRSAREVSLETEADARPHFDASVSQLEALLRHERREKMQSAVRALPPRMRRCATLRLYQQLDYEEIAVVLRISVSTVGVHLSQAKKQLTESLKEYSLASLDFGREEKS